MNTLINIGTLFASAIVVGAGVALGWRASNEAIDTTAAIIRRRQALAVKAAAAEALAKAEAEMA